ncbi:MAG: hypothetical protein IE891_10155 [Flavobacteriaceae bacterium]|nr:hypothetical protein [Flavobacteriaceae bacterium]
MKKIILSVLLILSISLTFAQDLENLKTEANKAYVAGAKMDFDAIFETTYPKVFEIVSQDMMKMAFDQMFNNVDFSIKLVQVEPDFNFGDFIKIGNQTFCMIQHNNKMIMTFNNKVDNANMMVDIFKSSMKTENVTFNEEENAFHITMRSTLIGVSDELTNNQWKFINKDENNQLSKMIFSEEVIKTLGL